MRCSIQCSSVYPLIGYLSYRDSKLNLGITLFFVHQEVLPFFLFWIRLDTSPHGYESLTIIYVEGPSIKWLSSFDYKCLQGLALKFSKRFGRGKYDFFTSTIHRVALSHWGLYHEFSVLWHSSFISVLQHDINVGHDVGWGFTMFFFLKFAMEPKWGWYIIKFSQVWLQTKCRSILWERLFIFWLLAWTMKVWKWF